MQPITSKSTPVAERIAPVKEKKTFVLPVLSPFIDMAKEINYKDVPPKLPQHLNESTFMGYMSRFTNWKRKLEHRYNEAVTQKRPKPIKAGYVWN